MDFPSYARKMLEADEGNEKFAYPDSKGYWTIGIGRNIDSRGGRGLSDDEIDLMFQNDLKENIRIATSYFPAFQGLSDARKYVLVSMAHQLGEKGLNGFVSLKQALLLKNWQGCYNSIMDSKMARVDSPARSLRLAKLMLQG